MNERGSFAFGVSLASHRPLVLGDEVGLALNVLLPVYRLTLVKLTHSPTVLHYLDDTWPISIEY